MSDYDHFVFSKVTNDLCLDIPNNYCVQNLFIDLQS